MRITTIRRKGYKRKAYTRCRTRKSCAICPMRTTCTKIKSARVGASRPYEKVFPYATGKARKLIKITHKGALKKYGYTIAGSATTRRDALSKAVGEYGATKVWRMLNAQVRFRQMRMDGQCVKNCNICRPDVKASCQAFLTDRDWIAENYKIEAPRAAIRAWKGMSHEARVRARAKLRVI